MQGTYGVRTAGHAGKGCKRNRESIRRAGTRKPENRRGNSRTGRSPSQSRRRRDSRDKGNNRKRSRSKESRSSRHRSVSRRTRTTSRSSPDESGREPSPPRRQQAPRPVAQWKVSGRPRGPSVHGRRVQCKAKKVATDASGGWKGINTEVRSQLIDLEKACEDDSWKARREVRRKRAALLKGLRPDVPPIKAVAHKYRSSSRGIHVRVVPDTRATMTLIP